MNGELDCLIATGVKSAAYVPFSSDFVPNSSLGCGLNQYAGYVRTVRNIKLLSRDEERGLSQRASFGDDSARELLAYHHLSLVPGIARNYRRRCIHLEILDLIQLGNEGLVEAAESFDITRGVRFQTHARIHINKGILRGIENEEKTIRLPVHLQSKIAKMDYVERELTEELRREPKICEIASKMGIKEEKVVFYKMVRHRDLPLDYCPPGKKPIIESLEARTSEYEDDLMGNAILKKKLLDEIKKLPDLEKFVLTHYFGVFGARKMTLSKIQRELDVSWHRVLKLKNSGLCLLKYSDTLRAGMFG